MLESESGEIYQFRGIRNLLPSANISLPLTSCNFATLSGFSADPGGVSPLKMSLPVSSWNFWLWIFFAVMSLDTSPKMTLLGPPEGCLQKREKISANSLPFALEKTRKSSRYFATQSL